MRKVSLFVIVLSLSVTVASVEAQQRDPNYLFDGKTHRTSNNNPTLLNHTRWQVWLYQEGVHIPHYSAGLQWSRWGLIEGSSAESVTKRLEDSQAFEKAYLKFFGPGTWGRFTFFNPVGPIAVTDQVLEDHPENLYELYRLLDRVNKLITTVRPSLENNENDDLRSPVKEYFDQVKDSLVRISRLYSELSHNHPQLQFIANGIAQTKTEVTLIENNVPEITAVLPSVRLPASKAWMSCAQKAGRDGTIQLEVTEIGSGVSIQQTWTGGDGSMTGTVILTTIPYNDIGKIDPPAGNSYDRWIVRIESATIPFPQTLDSPRRNTSRAMFHAVHSVGTEKWFYFIFPKSAEAQDAYAYFLYHKQVRR